MAGLKQLIQEVHRRSLWQVLLIYIAAGWVVFEIVQTVTEGLGLPQWFPAFAALLLLIGLPIVLATAFVQEGGPPLGRTDPTLLPGAELESEARPREVAGARRLFTWRNAISGGVLALALWGVVATGWLVFEGRPERETVQSAMTPAPGIAVLPFRVVGPEAELWREGIMDILSTNLEGVPGLRKIDPRAVLSHWRREIGEGAEPLDEQAAVRVPAAVGARSALMGSMVGSAAEVRIMAQVYDVQDGELRGSAQVEGSPDSILALADLLTLTLLRAGVVGESAALPKLALSRITTTSVEALKAYLRGEQQRRRSRWGEAIAEFTRAIEADSTFALAFARLVNVHGWVEGAGSPQARRYHRLARRFAHRLSERDALHMRASDQQGEGRLAAIETLQELVARYPDDVEAWYSLAEAYAHVGDQGLYSPDRYREAFRRALALDPGFGPAYPHLIEDAFARHDSADAWQLLGGYRRIEPVSMHLQGYALAYELVWGDSDAQATAWAAIDTIKSLALGVATNGLRHFPETWPDLRRVLETLQMPRHATQSRRALFRMADIQLKRGRVREARETLSRVGDRTAARISLIWHLLGYADTSAARRGADVLAAEPDRDRLLIGAFAAFEGRWEDVEREIAALRSDAERVLSNGDSLAAADRRALARAVYGYAALRRRDLRTAAEALEESLPRLPRLRVTGAGFRQIHGMLRYELGRALLEMDRSQETERYLLSVSSQRILAQWYNSTPAEFYLGQTYEALGDGEKAKLHYARFVRWWEDCDPELRPLWERGRQALARLAREPVSN